MNAREPVLHLPPHLQVVSGILTIGLLRLRARRSQQDHGEGLRHQVGGENSLHIPPELSMYPDPPTGRSE